MAGTFDISLDSLAGRSVASENASSEGTSASPESQRETRRAPQTAPCATGTQYGATFFLETFGCQMNDHDSEKVAGVLFSRGYQQVDSPDAASLVLYNTCSIREKAAQKVFSRLGEYRTKQAAGQIIGVLGCVAQQEGEEIFERAPWRAYLTIIEGCDKACAYCVVPYTRGPERSRASDSVLREVRELANLGFSEVQLLGQTVNSYADPSPRKMRFSDLLLAVADVPGIRRVRFTTSHPRDFGADIVAALEAQPKLCNHVHLPVQSGSTRVLRAMTRTYTRDEYLEKIAMLRGAKREIAITTDIIVGFPGETEDDFAETLSLLEEVRYDSVFSFKYSPRPNTPSLSMPDAISEIEKSRRLAILQETQREIQSQRNATLVGNAFEVLVSGKSRRENQWSGHTACHRVVNFASQQRELLGTYVQVRVTGAGPNSLVGEQVT